MYGAFVLLVGLLLPSTAHAYIDPSASSVVIQLLAFLAIAAGVCWTKLRDWTARFFRKVHRRNKEITPPGQ